MRFKYQHIDSDHEIGKSESMVEKIQSYWKQTTDIRITSDVAPSSSVL
jgi:hypothetical protein